MKRRLKINGIIIFLAMLLSALFPHIFFHRAKVAFWDEVMDMCGIAFILLGQIIRISSRGYKSEYSPDGHSLIQGGPYALVRNPMYLGILLIGLGVVLVLFNWWTISIFLCVFSLRYLLLILKEEKKLSTMFGRAYQDYRQRVPRFLPTLTAILQRDTAEYLPLKLVWLKKEIGSIILVLLGALLLESWEDIVSEGINAYFREAMLLLSVIIVFMFFIIYLIKQTNGQPKDAPDKSKTAL